MSASNCQTTQKKEQFWLLQMLVYYIPLFITVICFAGCLAVELLRIEISQEFRDWFYVNFGNTCYYSSIFLSTVYGRKYGLSWLKSLIFTALTFVLLFSWTSVGWGNLDGHIFGVGAVASYRSIIFLPLLCLLLSRFCKVDTLNLCDCLTPYFFFNHGIVTVACWLSGCCAGKNMGWGLTNPLTGLIVFPLQPGIILLSVAVAYWGLEYAKKCSYQSNGFVFANSLIIYGCGRYVLELFSDDPRIFWVLSWLAVCSLIMIVLGFFVRWISEKRYKTP